MPFFAPGGPPGFNQALLKGGPPPTAQPLASQVGKTDMSHRHDNTSKITHSISIKVFVTIMLILVLLLVH